MKIIDHLKSGKIFTRLRAKNNVRKMVQDLHVAAREMQPLRLIIGSAHLRQENWVASDIKALDVTREADWRKFFAPGSLDAIMAEHVWEHLTPAQALDGTRNCFSFLKPGAYFRIAVPDGLFPDPDYIEKVKVGIDDHKVLYTYQTLSNVLTQAGFEVNLLEYFDAAGIFHAQEWDTAKGMIRRSKLHDPRNQDGKIEYSSIIIDAIKPAT